MHDSDNPEDKFDDGVEMSDLPSDERYDRWARRVNEAWQFWSRARNRRRLTFALMIALLLLLISGSGSLLQGRIAGLFAPPGRSAGNVALAGPGLVDDVTGESNGVVSVQRLETGRLFLLRPGPSPQSCAPDGPISQKYKQRPLWIAGFNGPYGAIRLGQLALTTLRGWRGWVVPLLVEWRAARAAPLTLTVGDIGVGPVPTMITGRQMAPASSVLLDPRAARAIALPGGRHAIAWNITLYLPGAGCYYFDGSWPNVDWWIIFSAGT